MIACRACRLGIALVPFALAAAACSSPGPASGPGGTAAAPDGPLPEDVIVLSEPITTTSDFLVGGAGATEPSIRPAGDEQRAGIGVEAEGPATLDVVTRAELGTYLTDAAGRTVYLYAMDAPFSSSCDAVCLQNWPSVPTQGKPVAGEGVDAALLGTLLRPDGTEQVTYNGWPLYYSVDDTEPGTAFGQAVNGLWFVVSPTGERVEVE